MRRNNNEKKTNDGKYDGDSFSELFACGSKDTTSTSNGGARTNTEKEADTKNENVGTFSQLFTNNEVSVWYLCDAIDKEATPDVYVVYGDGTYLNMEGKRARHLQSYRNDR